MRTASIQNKKIKNQSVSKTVYKENNLCIGHVLVLWCFYMSLYASITVSKKRVCRLKSYLQVNCMNWIRSIFRISRTSSQVCMGDKSKNKIVNLCLFKCLLQLTSFYYQYELISTNKKLVDMFTIIAERKRRSIFN